MRILVLSDLHIEFWKNNLPTFDLSVSKPDVVVLAGDIHKGIQAVRWASETFPSVPVIYVHGNHEAYGSHLEDTQEAIQKASDASNNIFFLNQKELIIGNVRFLGCTFWSDFRLLGEGNRNLAMRHAKAFINDYRVIKTDFDDRVLTPDDTYCFNLRQREFLENKLESSFEGKTVVITHMAPSMQSVPDRFKKELLSAYYASDFDHYCAMADVWIHGHTHDSFDYKIAKCRVVCNPLGYPLSFGEQENPHFNPNFIVEV